MNFPFRKRRTLIWAAVTFLGILAVGYFARGALVRVYVAARIQHLHLFSPATPTSGWTAAQFYWDVAGLREQRDERLQRYQPELEPLVKAISKRQLHGEKTDLSDQIYNEVQWWVNCTPNSVMTERRLEDLRASLTPNADQSLADQQNPDDGSWGAGYTVWFWKLYGAVDESLSHGATPKYPLRFLNRIDSPEKLTEHMNAILRNDFTQTGMISRTELDDTASAVARLLFGDVRGSYKWQPGVEEAFLKFLDDWQNPETGCWGVWLVGRDGTVWREDDVGITFHMVSDCGAHVKHLDRIASRVLDLSAVDFPAGIRVNGHYENHLNWDVVKILGAAWPQMDEPTRRKARAEISRMLNWCLAESYQPDGSFKVSDMDDTPAQAMYYGFRFLRDAGFFSKEKRFWTDEDFPQANAILQQIEARQSAMGLN